MCLTPLYANKTDNRNKTWTLLQTTIDKDEPKAMHNFKRNKKNRLCEEKFEDTKAVIR